MNYDSIEYDELQNLFYVRLNGKWTTCDYSGRQILDFCTSKEESLQEA